jgi:hypothetical protein
LYIILFILYVSILNNYLFGGFSVIFYGFLINCILWSIKIFYFCTLLYFTINFQQKSIKLKFFILLVEYYLSFSWKMIPLIIILSGAVVTLGLPDVKVLDKFTGGPCQLVPVRYNFCRVEPPIASLLDEGWLIISGKVEVKNTAGNKWRYFSEVDSDTSAWCTYPFDKGNCGPNSNPFWGCDKKVQQTCVSRLASTTSLDDQMGSYRSLMNPILNRDTNTISIPELYSVVSCVRNHFDDYEFYICETHSSLKSFYLFQPGTLGENLAFSLENQSLVTIESELAEIAKKHCPENKWCSVSQSDNESLYEFEKGTPLERINENNTVVFFNAIKDVSNEENKKWTVIYTNLLLAIIIYLIVILFLIILKGKNRHLCSRQQNGYDQIV